MFIRFTKGTGFTQEAVLKDQFGKGRHAVIFRMMASDYVKLYPEIIHGKKQPLTAARA